MRVVFMGTPAFALPALERLLDSRHEVVAVVTQPDKPAGRGRKLQPPPVKVFAEKQGLPVLQPGTLKSDAAAEQIAAFRPDVLAVAAYGKIIPRRVFEQPRFGALNIHPSLLPEYRGAAPIQRAIMNGDISTGVTIMRIDETLDGGPIVRQEQVEILDDDDAVSLGNMLSALGAAMLVDTLDDAERTGTIPATPQDDSKATYADMIRPEEGLMDWNRSTDQLICQVRALVEWPTAWTHYNNSRVKVYRIEPGELTANLNPEKAARIPPGTICELIKGRGPLVKTGNGFALIRELQFEGKRRMSGADVVNGRLLEMGRRFESPATPA
ncbi:MAG: methionyl-tRNA formyltransferase [Candidatus Sumerlaeia bacterium]